jgi:hypothetical protein
MPDDPLNTSFSRLRRGRLTLRELCRADLPALTWIEGIAPTRAEILEAWPGEEPAKSLIAQFPAAQLAVELGQQLVGALLAYPEPAMLDAVAQPWTRREASSLPGWETRHEGGVDAMSPRADLRDSALRGVAVLWLDVISEAQVQTILTLGRKALVQQLGCEATFSLVRPAAWDAWRERMSPEAFLQQVHAGGIEDARLTPYLNAGYLMRGFWTVDQQQIEVAMIWARRAH